VCHFHIAMFNRLLGVPKAPAPAAPAPPPKPEVNVEQSLQTMEGKAQGLQQRIATMNSQINQKILQMKTTPSPFLKQQILQLMTQKKNLEQQAMTYQQMSGNLQNGARRD
jgi:hypothetical protein